MSLPMQLTGPPNLDQILQAIVTLYEGAENKSSAKELASNWLTTVQKSVYAWEVADQLLIKRASLHSCVFAAQTLRTKLKSDFLELPPESYFSLKNSLINHLKEIQDPAVQTPLALCITYLAILVPTWINPVEEIVASEINRFVLVEFITLLAEELDPSRQQHLRGVGERRRQEMLNYLEKISPNVVQILNNTLIEAKKQMEVVNPDDHDAQKPFEKLIAKIYRCLGAWLVIINSSDISCIEPILKDIFESLMATNTSDHIHDAAADTVCGATLLCENYEKYESLSHYLLNYIYQMEMVYQHSVIKEDIDKSVNYSRIFTEMAESLVNQLLTKPSVISTPEGQRNCLKLVNLVLECIQHYDYEVAEITFHFWFRFSEAIANSDASLCEFYCSVINGLLQGLTNHCVLDTDQDGLISEESEIQIFRARVKDLVKEVVVIIGASNYIRNNNVLAKLQDMLSKLSHDPGEWEEFEAILFIISCIVKDIHNDNDLLVDIFRLICSTSQCHVHPQIKATVCTIIGELNDWLEAQQFEVFSQAVQYLLLMVTDKRDVVKVSDRNDDEPSVNLSSLASQSFHKIIYSSAAKHLVNDQNLIQYLIPLCSDFENIDTNTMESLLKSCSIIIGLNNPTKTRQEQERLIMKLLEPNIQSLKLIVSDNFEHYNPSNFCDKYNPIIYFNHITSIFRNLQLAPKAFKEDGQLGQAVAELWPMISQVLLHFSRAKIAPVVERGCRCLRYIFRSLKPIQLLIPVADFIVNVYQHFPEFSVYLYLASILVDEFGDSKHLGLPDEVRENIDKGLYQMLEAFAIPTFSLLTSPNAELKNHPDTIEDFFRLCSRYLKTNPIRFLDSAVLPSILNLTLAALSIEHRDANTNVCTFICDFLIRHRDNPTVTKKIEDILTTENGQEGCFGQRLVDSCVRCSIFIAFGFINNIAEILWPLMNFDKQRFCKWLEKSLSSIPVKGDDGSGSPTPAQQMQHRTQIQEFYHDITKATHLKLVVSSLRNFSRLNS